MSTILSLDEINKSGVFSAEILSEDAQDGASLSKSALNKIGKWTRNVKEEDIVAWPILAIDTAPTRNKVIYSDESQKKTVKKWIGKTFLFNSMAAAGTWDFGPDHKLQAASQVARIFDAQLVKTPKGETGTLVWVYSVRAVSQQTDDFINKVEAGILREVSIHIAIPRGSGIQCSICKVPFADDKKDHYPGVIDGKQEVYAETVGVLEPLELSAVACPGSVNAHVMQDDEVEDYPVLSLREALGGARETLEAIMAQTTTTKTEGAKTAEQLAEEARVAAGAPPAVTTTESTTPPATTTENAPPAETTEAGKKKKADDPPADDPEEKQGDKPAFSLFEGHCPACGRDGAASAQSATPEAIQEAVDADRQTYREDVENRVTAITEAANKKVSDAEARATAAEKLAGNASALKELFDDFVKETVDIAIAKGAKAEDARATYMAELSALSYQGVKAVREALNVATGTSQREQARTKLAETSRERATREFGTTQVKETGEGRKGTAKRRPFAAPIGPR